MSHSGRMPDRWGPPVCRAWSGGTSAHRGLLRVLAQVLAGTVASLLVPDPFGAGMIESAVVLQESPQAGARSGASLAKGDVNGHGAQDVLVGVDPAEIGDDSKAGQC